MGNVKGVCAAAGEASPKERASEPTARRVEYRFQRDQPFTSVLLMNPGQGKCAVARAALGRGHAPGRLTHPPAKIRGMRQGEEAPAENVACVVEVQRSRSRNGAPAVGEVDAVIFGGRFGGT